MKNRIVLYILLLLLALWIPIINKYLYNATHTKKEFYFEIILYNSITIIIIIIIEFFFKKALLF